MLTVTERGRYDRQLGIRGFGEEGQEKLKRTKVVVAGAGGLGSASLTYLAEAGIGTIRLIDNDKVEISDLNRQILYWAEDIGRQKTDSASERLRRLNPEIGIEAINEMINKSNASRLVGDFDLIVDAMDNLPTRYILNRVALQKNIPFFHGAVSGFEGRVMTIIPGETACLNCVYRGRVPEKKSLVIGATPAIIGSIQVTEVIKYILGIGKLLTNRILVYDGWRATFTAFRVTKDSECRDCGRLESKESRRRGTLIN